MSLSDDLQRAALAAGEYGDEDESLAGVVAAEPASGRRVYLAAFERSDGAGEGKRTWLALDDDGRPLHGRAEVRGAASIVAMCELACEVAGGGELEELRAQLAQVRVAERPPGIEDAEEAALALEHAVGGVPRLASPAYLDGVGAATLALERALGDHSSPFASAMRAGTAVVDEFSDDVERAYRLELI